MSFCIHCSVLPHGVCHLVVKWFHESLAWHIPRASPTFLSALAATLFGEDAAVGDHAVNDDEDGVS